MPYFDATADGDLKLLHASVRSHAELTNVAGQAEADVLAKASYAAEGTEDEATGEEAEALRRTIADDTSHRLSYYDEDDTLTSESRGDRSKSREAGALDPEWPKNWRWRLREYAGAVWGV